jgi:hypothetical protein
MAMVFNTTFNNNSAISWRSVNIKPLKRMYNIELSKCEMHPYNKNVDI